MVPNTPPPPSDKEKEAHENAVDAGEGGPMAGRMHTGVWIECKIGSGLSLYRWQPLPNPPKNP